MWHWAFLTFIVLVHVDLHIYWGLLVHGEMCHRMEMETKTFNAQVDLHTILVTTSLQGPFRSLYSNLGVWCYLLVRICFLNFRLNFRWPISPSRFSCLRKLFRVCLHAGPYIYNHNYSQCPLTMFIISGDVDLQSLLHELIGFTFNCYR